MNKNLINAPSKDEANKGYKQLVEYCLETIGQIEESPYRKQTIEDIKKSNEVYNQVESPATEPWEGASSSVLPLLTISCDNLEPRIASSLVGKKPYVRIEPENDQPKSDQEEVIETFFNQELEDVVEIENFAGNFVNQLLREGTVFVIPEYSLKEETRREFVFVEDVMERMKPQIAEIAMQAQQAAQKNPEAAQEIMAFAEQQVMDMTPPAIGGVVVDAESGEPLYDDKTSVVFEGGKVEILPFTDVLIPDDVDDMESSPIFRKIRPTYAELIRDSQTKAGFIQENIGPWLCGEEGEPGIPEEDQTPSQKLVGVEVNAKKTIPCYECYVSYIPRKDDQEDDKETYDFTEQRFVVQIAKDSEILLRVIPLIELSFTNRHLITRARLFPQQKKSYGTSIYGKIKSIQEGATKTFNTAINVAEVTMIPWFLFTEASGLQNYTEGIQLAAGKGIKVDSTSPDSIYFPRFSINPDQILKWIDLWVSFWERLISIGDLQVGRSGSKDTTATETMAVIQEGNIKHNYQSLSVRHDFVNIIRTVYDMYYQYMPLDKTFLWNGQQVEISRRLMTRKVKFRLTGSTDLANKLIERKEKETFYALTAQDPNINPVKNSEELVKAYGHTDIQEWVHPNIRGMVKMIMSIPGADQVVQQALQQAAQMAAQQEAQAKAQQGAPPIQGQPQ
jgi:hypothetical protein